MQPCLNATFTPPRAAVELIGLSGRDWDGVPDVEHDLPTIVVEFVSRGKRDWIRDYEEKRGEYLALGVREYWVIDRFRRTMTVFRQPPAEPAEQVIDEKGTYRTPILPGFELPLARLSERGGSVEAASRLIETTDAPGGFGVDWW